MPTRGQEPSGRTDGWENTMYTPDAWELEGKVQEALPSLEILRRDSNIAFEEEFLPVLYRLTDAEACARVLPEGTPGLFTGGTVLSIVQHAITAKIVYGNVAFGDGTLEGQWDAVAEQVSAAVRDVASADRALKESHAAWMAGWADLPEADVCALRRTHWGEDWPVWRIVMHVAQHDLYHAGQIEMIRWMVQHKQSE